MNLRRAASFRINSGDDHAHFLNVPDLKSHWDAYAEAAESAGRTPDRREWRICRDIYVADTDEQARREVMESSMAYAYKEYFFPLLESVNGTNLWYDREDMQPADVTLESYGRPIPEA